MFQQFHGMGIYCLSCPCTKIPPRSIVMGVPGKVVRETNDEDIKRIESAVQDYLRLSESHHEGKYKKLH